MSEHIVSRRTASRRCCRNIAFFGARGTFGSRILTEALDRGYRITAVLQSPGDLAVSHPNLTVTTGDVLDPASVAAVAQGKDAVVSAIGGRQDGNAHAVLLRIAAESLIEGLRLLGTDAPRFVSVGCAGSPDTPGPPDPATPRGQGTPPGHGQGAVLDYLVTVSDVRWTHFSPAARTESGSRTGTFRLTLDDLARGPEGGTLIDAEDYAVALVDELDDPDHAHQRFHARH